MKACAWILAVFSLACSAQPANDFTPIHRGLTSPRCLNCHTGTAFPRQGDERRRHDFLVVRGADNRGAAAMRCSACHTAANSGNLPGAPHWSLAPPSMSWEGLSEGQLCRRLVDPQRNGRRSVEMLLQHMASDPLVGWGWAPGGQRQPVEMPKEEFLRALQAWSAAGARCPGTID